MIASDTVSENGIESCGPIVFSIDTDAPSYLTLDQLTNELSLQSNKQSDITDQPVTVTIFAALQNYNAVQRA